MYGDRLLYSERFMAETKAGPVSATEARRVAEEARETEPQRLRAHQVDLLLEKPARIVFAKASRFDHRLRFIDVGVGGEFGLRFREQGRASAKEVRRRGARPQAWSRA